MRKALPRRIPGSAEIPAAAIWRPPRVSIATLTRIAEGLRHWEPRDGSGTR